LVLGAGTISEQVVGQLRDRGVGHLLVMNRSFDRAEVLAREFGGKVVPWGDWDKSLLTPDVVVSSVSADEPALTRETLAHVMHARENRALFIMDLGVPRNVEGSAADIYNLYLYNVDDLTDIVQQNRNARAGEVPRAEAIVDEHVSKFLSWQASVELVGLLESLKARMKDQREAFVRDHMARLTHLNAEQRTQMEELMDELLHKVLLGPAERLRGEKELRRKIQNVEALRDLFLPGRDKL